MTGSALVPESRKADCLTGNQCLTHFGLDAGVLCIG